MRNHNRQLMAACLFGLLAPAVAHAEHTYAVGVAKVDVTPDYPIRLNGFGGRREESKGVSQPIYARAIAISQAECRPMVLVTIDNLGIRISMVDEVARRLKERFAVPRENLAVCFTHTHCGPKVNGASDNIFSEPIPHAHQEHIDRYTSELTDHIERVAVAAIESREPAQLSWGVGNVGFATNRRTSGGPVDHDLPMLVVRDEADNRIRAVYVSYACHCVTLSFNQVSGDWAGYAAEMIERTAPGAIALVSIGCGSDSNPSSGVTGDKVDIAESQGTEIATEVARLLKTDLRTVVGAPQATLARIALPLNDAPTKEQLQKLAAQGGPAGYNATTQLAKLDRGQRLLEAIDYPVQTFSFGDSLSIVFLAGEVCVDYSLRLKQELDDRRLWLNAYANDFCCYIPSERLVREGGYGGGGEIPYFALPSTLKPGLEQQIVTEVKRQVPRSLHAGSGTQGVPPKSPDASLGCLSTHDDLRVELVAAEPLVVDPVAIDFGPDGRLWVAEMNDYGHGVYEKFEQTGRVRWLRDTDGDGRFDVTETFVDGLRFPTDVKVQPNGVLICDAPDILLASDEDGDGKADTIETLYNGFDVRNAQARVNSLRFGLDNWLHGSGGLFGGLVTNTRTNEQIDLSGRDFRFHPTTREIEPVTGRTQQGRCRNDWGDWFGCTNSTLLLHYTIEDRYHRRNPLIAPPPTTVGVATGPDASKLIPAGELVRFELSGVPGQPTSACGLEIYRDRLLGHEYDGNAFICEPVHQLVHRLVLDPDGVSFQGHRSGNESDREFLASTDRWFRPVQIRTGPDGAIWVVDMYRYVIEHPRWIPQATLAELDVFAGQGRGRIYRVVPRDESRSTRPWPRLDTMNVEELVGQLDQPNGTVRDLAQQLIVSRGDRHSVALLRKLVRDATLPQGQLHALATLDGLGLVAAQDLLAATRSAHPEVVRHAIQLAEPWLSDPDVLAAIQRLATDSNPRVVRQVAYSLGESNSPAAAETLASLAASASHDIYLRAAILSSINQANVAAVLEAYAGVPAGKRGEIFSQLVSLAVRLGDAHGVNAAFRAVAESEGSESGSRFTNLAELLDAADGRAQLPWQQLDEQLLQSLRRWHDEASRAMVDTKQSDTTRLAALKLIGRHAGAGTSQLLEIDEDSRDLALRQLSDLISVREPIRIQQAAVDALARTGDACVAEMLLASWDRIGTSLRERILDALLSRDDWTRQLVAHVQADQLAASSFNAIRRQQLLTHRDASIRDIATQLFESAAASNRTAVIDAYRPALAAKADAERGRALFRKACSSCHRLEDHGHVVGPDLTALTNRDPEWLLTTVLDPSREVDARYIGWTAVDHSGRTVNGLLAEETSSSIRLLEADGKEHVILRSDIDELRSTNRSIMPEGIERDLSPRDVADVLAYVSQFDVPYKQIAGNEPRVIEATDMGELRLVASAAEIRGDQILFEQPLGNIGYWHGESDRVTWRIDTEQGGSFDVYLDFSCASESAGNRYRIDGLPEVIGGQVPATGGWDRYQQIQIGTTWLKPGRHAISVRSDGPLAKQALFDLREIRLVPAGERPQFAGRSAADVPLPRYANQIAPYLLDESQPTERRQSVIDLRPGMGPAIVSLLVEDIHDAEEEYRRIPWIWRVAIAMGRRNDGGELRDLLDVSLPQRGQPLRDWQAVVIGGGVINGISQLGLWPDERLREIIADVPDGAARWERALQLAATMADDESIRSGTRYDALRMIALDGWDKRGAHLQRYLSDGVPDELQMGAVSGLVDMQADEVAEVLIERLPGLSKRNQAIALAGLRRTQQRSLALRTAIEAGHVSKELATREE